jgi:ABC-type Fe3+/spermidine/putrescine transport system ATPase subunit
MTAVAGAIRLEGVAKRFGATKALEETDLSVAEGEFLTLLGPSGCGKTTLLRIVAGLETASAGKVYIGGRDVTAEPPHRRDVGIMFQDYALFPHMCLADNVAYGLKMRGVARDERRRCASAFLAKVGLDGLGARMPDAVSGGQRQRVALARALIVEPSVLLLDEPLGALDADMRRQMQGELKRVHREVGLTFVAVTHDQEEAMSMSDRIAVMSSGRVEQVATPRELYDRPATAFVARFVGACNVLPVRVVDRVGPGMTVFCEAIGHAFVADGGSASGPVEAVALRPEKITLGPAGSEGLPATVSLVLFSGHSIRVRIEVRGFGLEAVLPRDGSWSDGLGPGTEVSVRWADGSAVALASGAP